MPCQLVGKHGVDSSDRLGDSALLLQMALAAVVVRIGLIGQREKELRQAALSCGVVSEYWGEGGVAERLWQALAKRLPSSCVVRESVSRCQCCTIQADIMAVTNLRKHRTTCFSNRTVC